MEKLGVSNSAAIKSIVDGSGGDTRAPTSSSSSSVKSEVELAQSRLHSPIIDPDEEINEDDAFNSDDELLYSEFFPTTSRSRSNSINPVGLMTNMDNSSSNNTTAAIPQQQQQSMMNHSTIMSTNNNNNTPHAMSSRIETRRRAAAAATSNDYIVNKATVENNSLRRYSGGIGQQQQPQPMTTRSRSSSIAIDDHGGGSGGGRSRIFSIDFDPAILDFSENEIACGDTTLNTATTDVAAAGAAYSSAADVAALVKLATITSSSSSSGGCGDGDMRRTRGASVSFKDIPTTATSNTLSMLGNVLYQPQHHQQQRDRGFSFECFSLGILDDADDKQTSGFTKATGIDVDAIHQQSMLCSSSSNNSGSSNIQRPRGDSIIFDPTSFLMGGIHETSALSSSLLQQQHTYNNIGGDMNSRYPMMTGSSTGGDIALVAAAATLPMLSNNCMLQPPLMHTPLAIPTIMSPSRKVKKRGRYSMQQQQQQQLASSSGVGRKRGSPRVKTRGGIEDNSGQRERNVIAALSFTAGGNSNNNGNNNDPIIHVPRGNTNFSMTHSGMYHHGTQMLTSSSNTDSHYMNSNNGMDRSSSSSQSTTTCPMELINKGGRVGIYLPDERRARIAEFHTKRKVRIWRKRIKYDCRKKLADSRPRIKGRFVKRSDVEEIGIEGEVEGEIGGSLV